VPHGQVGVPVSSLDPCRDVGFNPMPSLVEVKPRIMEDGGGCSPVGLKQSQQQVMACEEQRAARALGVTLEHGRRAIVVPWILPPSGRVRT
jgi:hypothetical protein